MGIKGYNHPGKKHSVVAVNPDGSVAGIFDFIQDATKKYGIDRHSITNSCKRGSLCRGLRWYYEEDFKELFFYHREKLKYELDPKRDRFTGHLKPGEKLGKGYYHYSEEGKKRRTESARRTSKAMNNKAGSNWGRNLDRRKRIICIETKEQYLGIKDTAESIGTYYSHFYYALKKGISINGHHYTII